MANHLTRLVPSSFDRGEEQLANIGNIGVNTLEALMEFPNTTVRPGVFVAVHLVIGALVVADSPTGLGPAATRALGAGQTRAHDPLLAGCASPGDSLLREAIAVAPATRRTNRSGSISKPTM